MWTEIGIGIALFFISLLIDIAYANYSLAVNNYQVYKAANLSLVLHFLVAINTFEFVNHPIYMFPIACGAWVGTWIVLRGKDKSNSETT